MLPRNLQKPAKGLVSIAANATKLEESHPARCRGSCRHLPPETAKRNIHAPVAEYLCGDHAGMLQGPQNGVRHPTQSPDTGRRTADPLPYGPSHRKELAIR